MNDTIRKAHDKLDAAGVCLADGTHPPLVRRLVMLVDERDALVQENVELRAWFLTFFEAGDLAKTKDGWKVDNPMVGWVDAPDWLVAMLTAKEKT